MIEYYKTKDRDILSVFSIYLSSDDNMINELYYNNGYQLFHPVYDKNKNIYFIIKYKK